jgi:hypothetical protein
MRVSPLSKKRANPVIVTSFKKELSGTQLQMGFQPVPTS